jgi:thioesterase domain-containing protein
MRAAGDAELAENNAVQAGGLELLTEATNSVDSSDVRPINTQAANLPPLFLLPGSLGYGPSLTELVAAIGKNAREFPIRYPNLNLILGGRDKLSDMAAAAVAQISKAQPSGPIRILGHSLGGAVAFEVATRLLAAGRSISFIGLLDTSLMGERSTYWKMLTRTIQRIRANRVTTSRMACRALAKMTVAAGYEDALATQIDRLTKRRFSLTAFRIRLELEEVLRERAYFGWSGEPKTMLPLTVTLFRCERKGMPQALGWECAFARVDVIPIVGGHVDLAMHPHVVSNAPLIARALVNTYSQIEMTTDAAL